MPAQHAKVILVQQQRVGTQHSVTFEKAQTIQMLHRAGARSLLDHLLLITILGHMQMQRKAPSSGCLGGAAEQLVRTGVCGMRPEHRLNARTSVTPAFGKGQTLLDLPFGNLLVAFVQ